MRTLFFFLSPTTQRGRDFFLNDDEYRRKDPLFTIGADIGELLYFVAFSLLGLFWAQVAFSANQRSDTYRRAVRPAFVVFVGLFLLGKLACWILLFSLSVCSFVPPAAPARKQAHERSHKQASTHAQPEHTLKVLHSSYILDIVMYCACVFFTVWFASTVFSKVYQNPVKSVARTRKLHEVLTVTTACLLFLVFHTFTTLVSLFGLNVHSLSSIVIAVLEVVCEFVPAVMLLFVLRKVPRGQRGPGITPGFRGVEKPLLR